MPFLALLALCLVLLCAPPADPPAPARSGPELALDAPPAPEMVGPRSPLRLLWMGNTLCAFWSRDGFQWWARFDRPGGTASPPERLAQEDNSRVTAVAPTPEGFAFVVHRHRRVGGRRPWTKHWGELQRFGRDGARLGAPVTVYEGTAQDAALYALPDGRMALLLADAGSQGLVSLQLQRLRPDGVLSRVPQWLGPYPRAMLRWDSALSGSTVLVAAAYRSADGQRSLYAQRAPFDASDPQPPVLVGSAAVGDEEPVSVALDAGFGVSWGLPAGVFFARAAADGALGPLWRIADAPAARHAVALSAQYLDATMVLSGSQGLLVQRLAPRGRPDVPPFPLRAGAAVTLSAPLQFHDETLFLEQRRDPEDPCSIAAFTLDNRGVEQPARCVASRRM